MKLIKKLTIIFAASVLFLSAFSVSAESETENNGGEETSTVSQDTIISGDYSYYVKTGNNGDQVAVLEEYTGSDTEVVIPETIDGYKVESLGNSTFADNHNITSITIPSGLESMGIYPFYGCTSVMEYKVSDENQVYKSDSDGALVDINDLSITAYPVGKKPVSYTVPEGVVLINTSAFAMCDSLKNIVFPDSLEVIGDFAFSECTSLESVTLPDNVTELSRFAFSGCAAIKNVKLSNSLQTIGDAAFSNCKLLTSIELPETVIEIGQAAFCSTGLTSVTIPKAVTSIGYSAFGFSADSSNQIVQDDGFVIKGYASSAALTYCGENGITFSVIEEETTEGTAEEDAAAEDQETENKKSKLPLGTVVGIGVVFAVAAVMVVFIIVRSAEKSRKNENGSESTEDNE